MRVTRNAQASIFEFYAEHEFVARLSGLSDLLDAHPEILELIAKDLVDPETTGTGACGLSVETVLRCLLLKQILEVSYSTLAFHLCDSPTYRTFARLQEDQMPSRSGLQSTIRRILPQTLEKSNQLAMSSWVDEKILSVKSLRIDSTVVKSNILTPSDSQLLDDGVRVLSRLMFQSKKRTGVKIRFVDQRKASKSLAFRIFNAKKAGKDALYPNLLRCVTVVLNQLNKAIDKVRMEANNKDIAQAWIEEVEHYRTLLLQVVDQTQRRVFNDEKVPSFEKIVSLFEPHTDIIVKDTRDVLYGHKVNLATQEDGFITYCNVEEGNPCDSILFLPVLDACHAHYQRYPTSSVADGCYASKANAESAKQRGVSHRVFNKPAGLTLLDMGVKKKTFKLLRNFRAGVEGNISEFKRAFGASKATWKGHEGFKAYVWSSVLSYNLIRMVRFSSA